MMDELKPCPFCGADAKYSVTSDEGQQNDYDTVGCSVCPSEMLRILHWADKGGENKADLFRAWNRRSAPRDEVIARLVEAVENLLRNYLQDELDEPDLCVNDDHWTAIHDVDTALAAAKAVQHG